MNMINYGISIKNEFKQKINQIQFIERQDKWENLIFNNIISFE